MHMSLMQNLQRNLTPESEIAVLVDGCDSLVLALIKYFGHCSFLSTYSCHLPGYMIHAIAKVCYAALGHSWQKVVFLRLAVLDVLLPKASNPQDNADSHRGVNTGVA